MFFGLWIPFRGFEVLQALALHALKQYYMMHNPLHDKNMELLVVQSI